MSPAIDRSRRDPAAPYHRPAPRPSPAHPPEGRILGWLLSLYALAVFGYITAMIASFFVGQDRGETEQSLPAEELAVLRTEIAALRDELAVNERRRR